MIRVLIVDDSAYNRMTFTNILSRHPSIQVVDTARDGEDAIKKILRHNPDVVTLDLEMPGMDGFSVLRWAMKHHPLPILVISAQATRDNVFKALELGAVDFLAKPTSRASPVLQTLELELLDKVLAAKQMKPQALKEETAAAEPLPETVVSSAYELLVIGASTGGPAALQKILTALPVLPIPVVVAQHMPPVFTALFAQRLNRIAQMKVKEGKSGETLKSGAVYIGPGGHHISLSRDRKQNIILNTEPKKASDLYAPSVDRLFQSASQVAPKTTLGIILTGMGSDGALGALHLKKAGSYCFVEDESTAVVYGMPAEALRQGGAEKALPLWEIPSFILQCLSEKPGKL